MDELMHYGVKGMKWGIRKDKDKDSKTSSVTVDGMPATLGKDGAYHIPLRGHTKGFIVWKDGTVTSDGKIISVGKGSGAATSQLDNVDELSPEEEEMLEELQKMTDSVYDELSPEEKKVIKQTKAKVSAFLSAQGDKLIYNAIKTKRKVEYLKDKVEWTIESSERRYKNTKHEVEIKVDSLKQTGKDKVNKILKRGKYAPLKVDSNGRLVGRSNSANQAPAYVRPNRKKKKGKRWSSS